VLRLLVLLAAATVLCKWVFGRWPWDFLRSQSTRGQALSRARKLLAVPEQASRQEILEAHKRLVAMVHPDRGGTSAQVHEANAARDLLLGDLPER